MIEWALAGVIVFFIAYIFWLGWEIRRAPLIEDSPPCSYCRDTGYVRFELWKGSYELGKPLPTREVHERPCHCTAGIGKERRKIA